MVRKVVIIGPESTGKSTLCKQLAAHYNTVWCAEYAREYLLQNGTDYNYDDLLTIAKGQLALEQEAESALVDGSWSLERSNKNEKDALPVFTSDQLPTTSYLFIDTNQVVMQVWCEFVFNQCHTWILNRIAASSYDLYLLCDVDLPWVKDALREYPDEGPRKKLYHMYKDIMVNQQVPWVNISGDYGERLRKAKQAIDHYHLNHSVQL